MRRVLVQDSGADGIGAEDLIKGAGGYQEAYYTDNTKTPGAIKAGTKVLKKKPKKKVRAMLNAAC